MKDIHTNLTKTARGHVERVGKDMYLAVLSDDKKNHYELWELDPYAATQAAEAFCARNEMALVEFSVSEEVKRAHLDDIGDLAETHIGALRPEFVPLFKKAV